MLKKILLSLLIFCVIYVLLIFNIPGVAKTIENTIGLKGLNDFILQFKGDYDKTVTNIPSQNEVKNAYNTIQSGAIEFKENFDLGVDYTKEKIDSIRGTLSGVSDTIGDVKKTYDDTKQFIDTNSGVIKNVQETIQTNSGIIKKVENTINPYSGTIK